MTPPPAETVPLRRALARYRVMAMVVGTALVLLVFVAIPLQYGAHVALVARIVAPIHGYLYLVYLVTGADLARRAHWRLGRILAVAAAGFVPFVAFIVERRVTRQMRAEWAEPSAAGSDGLRGERDGDDRQVGAGHAEPVP